MKYLRTHHGQTIPAEGVSSAELSFSGVLETVSEELGELKPWVCQLNDKLVSSLNDFELSLKYKLFPPEKCSLSVNRLNKRPLPAWQEIIERGERWSDPDFAREDQLYWYGYDDFQTVFTNKWDLMTRQVYWQRLHTRYPGATLLNSDKSQLVADV